VDLSNAVLVLGFLFLGGRSPACLEAADVHDSGMADLSDVVYLLNHLFLGGAAPPPPFVEQGIDTTADLLSCE
jgi:hypothetical protein